MDKAYQKELCSQKLKEKDVNHTEAGLSPNAREEEPTYHGKAQVCTGFPRRTLQVFPGFFLQLTIRKEKRTRGRNVQKEPGCVLGKFSNCKKTT